MGTKPYICLLIALLCLSAPSCQAEETDTFAHNISSSPKMEYILFRQNEPRSSPSEAKIFLIDLKANQVFSLSTETKDDASILYLNIEKGVTQGVGTIYDNKQKTYHIISANLKEGTYERLLTSSTPILDVAYCSDTGIIFIGGKERWEGVNRMTGRSIQSLDVITGKVHQISEKKYYQATLLHVDTDCKGAYFHYFQDNDGLSHTHENMDKEISLPESLMSNAKRTPFGGDINPKTEIIAIRKGFYKNGDVYLIKKSNVLFQEPYNFASQMQLTPEGDIAIQVESHEDPQKNKIFSYNAKTLEKQSIPLESFSHSSLTLRESKKTKPSLPQNP